MVEDIAADAELILKELQRAGISCDARRVETAVEYRRELSDFLPDVVLSDFTMPSFNGMEALAIARQAHPDTPFIFVSGTLGEEYAVRALKSGATDYILKDNLLRLPAAVERAMNDIRERRVRQAFERDLRDSERRYRLVFQSHPQPTWVYDIATSRILVANDAAVTRYGFSREEFLAMTVHDILPGEKERRGPEQRVEKHRTKTGELIDAAVASSDIELDERAVRIVVASRP